MVFMAQWMFDLVAKLIKISSWEEHGASDILLIFLAIAFLVVSFIPLRLIVCLAIVNKFHEGSTWYERRWKSN